MSEHCQFYVVRKKRYCRMTLRAGSKFCGEHEPKVEATGDVIKENPNVRIACPLDPKHTCFANKLEKHLKICNAKQGELPPYISKNCNVSDEAVDCVQDNSSGKRCLSSVSEDIVKDVIALVEKIYDELILGNISSFADKECHPVVAEDIDNDGRKDGTRRHLLQTSSLLYLLESEGLMKPCTSFVELGAGKGHLSYYLSKAVNDIPQCSVVLVDRASHRHKQDNKLKEDCTVKVNRIRADISDLVLANVPSIQSSSSVVAVSKHLCGVATDLALRCLTNADVINKTAGLVMATCCHHRCVWNTYVGKSFLQAKGIAQSQFDVICGLVSWATCGSGLSRERRNYLVNDSMSSKEPKRSRLGSESEETMVEDKNNLNIDKNNEDLTIRRMKDNSGSSSDNIENASDKISSDLEKSNVKTPDKLSKNDKKNDYYSLSKHLGLSLKQREEIGFKAKAVIDWGRMVFLKENNFIPHLCFYVDKALSPENVCIVATRSKTV